MARNDIRQGLRVRGFEKRTVSVAIDRILYADATLIPELNP